MGLGINPASSGLILGVDGGQTSTLTVLATIEGKVLGTAVTGPANHIHEPGGRERQYATLRSGYEQAFQDAGLKPTKVHSACLGITGSGNLEVVTEAIPAENLVLKGDVETALVGAIPKRVGVVVISGTGSNAYGCNHVGNCSRAGGWGYIAGDEGSGYDIACQAVKAVFQASDGRGGETQLTSLILRHFQCEDLRHLHGRIYSGELSRDTLASAAATVGAAANHGDAKAKAILSNAGRELGNAVAAVLSSLKATTSFMPVAFIGGVFKSGDPILQPMLNRIQEANPTAQLVKPKYPPVIGAVIQALQSIGVPLSPPIHQNLERIKESLPKT